MAYSVGNDDLDLVNFQVPGFQEDVYTTPGNNLPSQNNAPVEFLKNFRPELVTHPGQFQVQLSVQPGWSPELKHFQTIDELCKNKGSNLEDQHQLY